MRRTLTVLLLFSLATPPATAQTTLVADARDASHQSDSLGMLRSLSDAVRTNPQDHAAWNRRGVLAWLLARAERRRHGNDESSALFAIADSSLNRAVELADTSARYLVDLARFRSASSWALTRRNARGLFERARDLARERGDAVALGDALAALGVAAWRKYEGIADRHIYSAIYRDPDAEGLIDDEYAIAYFIENRSRLTASKNWSGQLEYEDARRLFTEALEADPKNQRARAGLFMMLVERQRWEEARHEALVHLRNAPCDALAWLTRGLAAHRLQAVDEAAAAFDTALFCLPDHERDRLDALARVLSPADSRQHAQLPGDEQVRTRSLYWLMADPLWLTRVNEHRLEYLSRITTAELQWSVEELDIRGADTDRGDLFVRYGQPPAVISFPPDAELTQEMRIRVLWWYRDGVAFVFRLTPGYGLAALHTDYARYVRGLRDTIPVSWAGLGTENAIDTIQIQTVRFRGAADSSDVLVIADVPEGLLVRGLDLARASLEIGLNFFNGRAQHVARDSIRAVLDVERAELVHTRAWRKRLPPGAYVYRVEALQPDALRGARASSSLEIVADDGFGMSDVLFARMIEPKTGAVGNRWSEFRILPMTGILRRSEPLAVLWETYALSADSGANRYRVSITIEQRETRGALGRIGAAIVGGVRAAVGRASGGEGRVTLTYDRDLPATPVALDYLTVDASALAAGEYTVTVQVEDVVSNRRASRSKTLTVIE